MTDHKRSCARLHLFGPLRLLAADGTDVTPRGQKARGLLAMLALARDSRLARATAAARLWSGSHDAKANLRQCLRELRAALDAAETELLQADDQTLVLNCQRLAVDALDLDRSGTEAQFDLDSFDDDRLLRDIEIIDPVFEDWLTPERTRCRDRLHHGLEARADACLAAANQAGALHWATRLIGFDPTLETAHRISMRAHADQGNRSLALRQFEICRERLAAELGVGPSEATLALRARIARPPQRQAASHSTAQVAARATPENPSEVPNASGRSWGSTLDWLDAHRLGPPIYGAAIAIRIALAPVNVLSEAPGDQIHAMIVSEAVAAALSRFTDLAVIDSAMAAADASRLATIAYSVDGSVARLGNTRRLTMRLWRSIDGMLLWAEHFGLEGVSDGDALDQLALHVAGRLEEAVLSHEPQEAEQLENLAFSARQIAANVPA